MPDKIESLVVNAADQVFVITDNEGVDGSNGETQFLPSWPTALTVIEPALA